MEVVNNTFLPGDPRLIDHIVYELKSQGIFDNFRKECIADVDTKPAYQNLRQRVEGSVSGFLKTQKWRSDMNKNHVREMLRKNISESGFLETGVERIVDQVVNPKINSIFLPQVENVVYKVLGISKPNVFDDLKSQINEENMKMDLLPNDLEAVSPESESHEKRADTSIDLKGEDKNDEDESPPFEPLEEGMSLEENSVDSNLSGISGLASHDSNHSIENKPIPMEASNQDSVFSKQSSDDRLSVVMSDDQEIKAEVNDDSNTSKTSAGKITETCKTSDVPDSVLTEKPIQPSEKSEEQEKLEEKRVDSKKSDKHRSSHRHSSHRSRHDSRDHKDRKSDRDKKDHKSSRSGEDTKERREKDKDKKDKSKSGRDDKGNKHSKERERTSSNSKHKKRTESEHKDDKIKSESKDTKSRDRSKEDSKLKSHNSKNSDSKNHSKHNGKTKTDTLKDADKKSDKHKKDDKHSGEKKSDVKVKDKKESKKNGKKEKDDHYGLKEKKTHRRSTDRDSSDGHSGTHSSSSSYTELTTPSQIQKSGQQSSLVSGTSSTGDSGNSEAVLTTNNFNISSIPCVLSDQEHSQILASVPQLKLIKPKFASNIYEAKRLMKIRRKLGKLEKQNQMELMRNSLNTMATNKVNNHIKHGGSGESHKKAHSNNSHVKSYKYEKSVIGEDNLVEEVQLSDFTELQTSVISKESWDAIEAKLNAQNILKVDYNSYTEVTEEKLKVAADESGYKGFSVPEQLEANVHLNTLNKLVTERESILSKSCGDYISQMRKEKFIQKDVNEMNKLPKVEIVDMKNNEVVFSPGRGVKRIANDHDVHNNNKVNKGLGDLLSDRLNEITENHEQSPSLTAKTKKSKLIDMSVNPLDNFNLPLSPAESDKSFNSVGDKKADVIDGRGRRSRAINSQRYSSDDLYKPRLQFSSSKRRRITKNLEDN